jgi:hypothetical protein
MKKKSIIAIVWMLSILLALWFGSHVGMRVGKAMYHNENIRCLQVELAEASKACDDPKMKGTIDAIRHRISTMGDPEKHRTAVETMEARLTEVQHKVPDEVRKLADPQH